MAEQLLDRPLSNEQLRDLRDEIRLVQEPYIQLLVELYSVSLPTMFIADGIVETNYAPEVELQAEKIRAEMHTAVEMAVRYRVLRGRSQKWIPVEEKLPKPVTDVLVTVQRYAWSNSGKTLQPADSWVQICSMRPDKVWIDDETTIGTRDEKKSAKFHNSEYREVTHWMPLPEPPAIREKIAQEKPR